MKKTTIIFSVLVTFSNIMAPAQSVSDIVSAGAALPAVSTPERAATKSAADAGVRFVLPRGTTLPPDAFTSPTNFILLVNHNGALDKEWLDGESDHMQKQLRVKVQAEAAEGEIGSNAQAYVDSIRDKHAGNAKIVIVVSEEAGLSPILAAPYDNWVVMDAGWVKRGGGDQEKIDYRMARRIFQALGHCIGAGYRMEREAVMRYTPTPEALDDCLSHGFHPLNSNIFMVVAQGIGLDTITPRPRDELIKLGVLKPVAPKPEGEPVPPAKE